jgi:hypothetical protein
LPTLEFVPLPFSHEDTMNTKELLARLRRADQFIAAIVVHRVFA